MAEESGSGEMYSDADTETGQPIKPTSGADVLRDAQSKGISPPDDAEADGSREPSD